MLACSMGREDKGMIKGIHHVALKCCGNEEFEKVVGFYRDVLGLEVLRSWSEGTMLTTGAGIIEIFNDGDDHPVQGAIRHFAFSTDNVDEVAEAVRTAGYEVFIEPKDIQIQSDPVFPARIAFCRGPLGEEIELFQEKA